jgi:FSR family fosmidomycin resistance protein-like MFS transporter
LLAILRLSPGTVPFFAAAALAGALIYMSIPIKVIVAQDLAPQSPAAAAGMVLGVTAGAAGVLYVGLGRLQELVGLAPGLAAGFALVLPAAALALAVLVRHPEAAR